MRIHQPGGGVALWLSVSALLGGLSVASAQDGDLVLRIEGPQTELTTGSSFHATVRLDTRVDGVQGWSFGVAHDPAALELTGAAEGATTLTVAEGAPPQFLVVNAEPAVGTGVTMAVVISFTQPISLSVGDGYDLLGMDYTVVADPTAADPCEPLVTTIGFSDEIGDPPVSTVLTVDGATRAPDRVDADVTVRCPGTIEFTRCEGDTENVTLEWAFGGAPDWDFLFLYRDGELLAPLEIDAQAYLDEGLEPGDYVYTLVTFVFDDPATPRLLFDSCTATVIPVTVDSVEPALGNWLGGDEIVVRGTAFTSAETTTLTFFADGVDPVELEVLEVVDETELRAVTPRAPAVGVFSLRLENERGAAELPDAFEYGFVRGEMNGDGVVDISDAIFILGFLFLGEVDVVPCRDSADSTDDGLLDISDAIRVLSFLFLGAAPPEAPYPGPGRDETADDLGCLEDLGTP